MSAKRDSLLKINDLLDTLKCSSCKNVLVDPYCSNKDECDHYICSACLNTFVKVFFCPACGTRHVISKDMVRSETLGEIIAVSLKLEKQIKSRRNELIKEERKRESVLKDDEIETPTKYDAQRSAAVRGIKPKKQKESEMRPGLHTVQAIVHKDFDAEGEIEKKSKGAINETTPKGQITGESNKESSSAVSATMDSSPRRQNQFKRRQSIRLSIDYSDLAITPKNNRSLSKTTEKRNKKGETPLHVACIQDNYDNVLKLLEDGADPNTSDNAGWTPLHEVVIRGNCKLAELLLKNNALADVPGVDNETPLHEAVRYGYRNVIELLCNYGANFEAKNNRGETPFSLADTATRQLFRDHGDVSCTTELHANASNIQIDDDMDNMRVVGFDLTRQQSGRLNELAKHHKKLTVEAKLTPATTHVLVKTDDNRKCPLSLNVLQAIVQSRWILTTKWIDECTNLDLANVHHFKVKGIKGYDQNGPERSRMNRFLKKPKLFDQCHFYFKGVNSPYDLSPNLSVNKQILSSLVADAGGEVLRREPCPEAVCGEIRHPYHAKSGGRLQKCSYYIIYTTYTEPCYNMEHIKALPLGWLFDCICSYELKEP